MFETLVNLYTLFSATDNYIFGFIFGGKVYIAFIEKADLHLYAKLDKASRGAGYSLRFSPSHAQKAHMVNNGMAVVLCDMHDFTMQVQGNIYNRGENFERLVYEFFGMSWKKDTVKFSVDGDITINGKKWQIKFQRATYASEKTLTQMAS